jgi:hypothetical protein
MRGVLLTVLAGLLVVFIVSSPKPASALAAGAALNYSHAKTDLVEVKKYYKRRYYRRPYYRPYRHYRRPYYRPYRYYRRPYYRRYGYRPYRYYRPYYRPYWGRPGVSVWFGF